MPPSHSAAPGPFASAVLRRALLIFLPAALVTGGVVLALVYQDRANERILYEQAGAHLVDLHADIITRELKAVQSDLLYLAKQKPLADFLSNGRTSKAELEDEYILFCGQKAVYDQIRYLDATGQERIRVNYDNGKPAAVADKELQPKGDRYYFTQTMHLERGEVFVSPFDLNVEHGEIEQPMKPVIRFATPVFDRDGAKRGIVILNYLGAALITRLAQVSVSFPGKAQLLNADGYFLMGATPSDEWGFMFGNKRTFATYHPEAWEHIAGNERGQFDTAQGLFTFRALAPGARKPLAPSPPAPLPRNGGEGGVDPDAADARLIVVSHVSPDVLTQRTTLLLHRLLLLYGVALLLLLGLAWYLGYVGALRREHERQLADSEGRLRTLSAQLITAQEEERRHIARDLHDEMGQVVTAMTLALQRAAHATDIDKKNDLIANSLKGAERLLHTIHEVVARVRPPLLDDLGLKDAVQSYLSDYEHRSGVPVRADLRFDSTDVPAIVSENIYRILQEALTNVSKHARATEVHVELHVSPKHGTLIVRDDGGGFDPASLDGKRLGILGMRERAELLDGTFTVQSAPAKGTEIRVTLPMR
jgi:signal transduction histidine kinase